jgi:hypothetical protein
MTEKSIQIAVRRWFGNYDYKLCNTFLFNWESDFFAISKSGYSVEVEIKISKADFKKDFTHKVDKHQLLSNHKKPAVMKYKIPHEPRLRRGETEYAWFHGESSSVSFCCPANYIPNKFYYACPDGLIKVEDLPPYAGLLYTGNGNVWEVKPAPFLHKIKKNHNGELLSKYYHKHINDRNEIVQLLYVLDKDNLTQYQRSALRRIRYKML